LIEHTFATKERPIEGRHIKLSKLSANTKEENFPKKKTV
jgi:hypothetical protein